jgi:hypothetical protein
MYSQNLKKVWVSTWRNGISLALCDYESDIKETIE